MTQCEGVRVGAESISARLTAPIVVRADNVPFVVPDKIFGLTLILDFIDHGTRLCPASSATGSAGQRGRPYSVFDKPEFEFIILNS